MKFIGESVDDDEFLAVGLADAMITRLSKVSRLVVRPTSSVLRFADWEDLFAAGRELGVDSAARSDAQANASLWEDKFNEKFTDVLELEDLVAEKTAGILIPKLTGEEQKKLARRGTNNPQAFEAYLRGRYHMSIFTSAELARAKEHFERAVRLDPEYALAYFGLADYYFALGTFGSVAPVESFGKAQEMAERALQIDDSLGEANAVLGFTYFTDPDFERVEKTLRRSIELNPNYSLSRIWLSVLLNFYGKHEEAVEEARRAAELNPLSGFDRQHRAWILYHARRFDEAVTRTRALLKDEPNFSHALGVLGWMLRHRGESAESLKYAERAVQLSGGNPWFVASFAASCAEAGQMEKARRILADLEKISAEKFVSPFCMAVAYCALGETNRAFAELENALKTRDLWLVWIASEPQFDRLRDDERYRDLLRRMNYPQSNEG